jgi:TRAP-type C4-dicarboxylate transport system permease small subunit
MRNLEKLVWFLSTVQLVASGTLFVALITVYAIEVFVRNAFGGGFVEYYEIVGIGFLYVFMFGAAALYGRDEDITVSFIFLRAPSGLKAWWVLTVYVLICATTVVLGWESWKLISLQWTTPTPLLGVPESTRVVPVFAASISIAITSGCRIVACIVWLISGTRSQLLPPFEAPGFPEEVTMYD